jgi:hypothetical protein
MQIYVDFMNCDPQGRVRLNTVGSLRSISELEGAGIALKDGMIVELSDKNFHPIHGVLEYSTEERIWAAHFKLEDLVPWPD